MKGFIAMAVAHAERFLQSDAPFALHYAFSYEEEIGCFGVRELIADLRDAGIRPLACIVGEPTSMVPAIAHKGVYRYRCCVRGKEAHSSLTPHSVNAIEMAARVVGKLRDMAEGFERDFKAAKLEWRNVKLLKPLSEKADVLIFDCPPTLSPSVEQLLQEVDILLIPMIPSPLSIRAMEHLARAAAIAYGSYVALANRVGVEGPLCFAGGSMIIAPDGAVRARADDLREDRIDAELSLDAVAAARRPYAHARDDDPRLVARELARMLGEG